MSFNTRKAVFDKLSATSGVTSKVSTRIYHAQAPQSATFPYVIFFKSSGTKVRAFQTPESFKRETWTIKAVARDSSAKEAEEVAGAIDSAFDGGTISVSGKTVADLNHTGDVDFIENDGDQRYYHVGGSYRITLT